MRRKPSFNMQDVRDILIRFGISLPDPWEVLNQVLSAHGVEYAELVSRHRNERLFRCRQEAAKQLREKCVLSWPEIAAMFGRKHHSGIHSAVKRMKEVA